MKKKTNKEAVKAENIVASLGAVTKEKSVGMELVLETLKDALVTAAKKYLNSQINVEAKVDKDKGTIEVYTCRKVVETVEDPIFEISLEDARGEFGKDVALGEEVSEDLDINLFGRMAIQTAKQVIIQRVREAERDRIFTDYSERIGQIVTGKVQQVERGTILIDIGRTEAVMPFREQIRKEKHKQGANIRACIIDVKTGVKGPQVIVSRTNPAFLERLFESEVPEISDKTVKIVRVVRDPGQRSKIAVTTSDPRVDPVGACVGMRGNRVQNIVRELSNERIDIIHWTDELTLLVRRVFSPADVKKVIPVGDKKIIVVIAEEGLALAIGSGGQNIRLASKMLEREVDVFSEEEFAGLSDEQRAEVLCASPQEIADDEESSNKNDEKSADDNNDDANAVNNKDNDDDADVINNSSDNNDDDDDDDDAIGNEAVVINDAAGAADDDGESSTAADNNGGNDGDSSVQGDIFERAIDELSQTDDDSQTAIIVTNSGEV